MWRTSLNLNISVYLFAINSLVIFSVFAASFFWLVIPFTIIIIPFTIVLYCIKATIWVSKTDIRVLQHGWFRTTMYDLFGTPKDSVASNNCYSYRNAFWNGVISLSKTCSKKTTTTTTTTFLCQKAQRVLVFQNKRFCSNFTSTRGTNIFWMNVERF